MPQLEFFDLLAIHAVPGTLPAMLKEVLRLEIIVTSIGQKFVSCNLRSN